MPAPLMKGRVAAARERVKRREKGSCRPDVLHVITGLETGGAERMLYRLLGAVPVGRHAVVCLREAGPIAADIESLGVPVQALEMRPGWPSMRAFLMLRRQVGRMRPRIVHGWMYHGCLAATLACRGVPVVWGIHHGSDPGSRERRRTRAVVRLLARLSGRPSSVVYCSRASARRHRELGFRPPGERVIANGFDTNEFRPDSLGRRAVRAEIGVSEATLVVGHIARFHPAKDHATFLAAAARLAGSLPDVHFVMAGRDVHPGNRFLRRSVSREGLEGRVDLLGERRDVPRLLNALDLLVSSSHGEAFPLVLGEAMATGILCVTTDVGDSAAIVGSCGRIVPPRDPGALADASWELLTMEASDRRRLAEAARRHIVETFPLERVTEEYEALYARVGRKAA